MLMRTPLRIGRAMVWADPVSGTVKASVWADPDSGTVEADVTNRARTLLAGLDPACYLVACGGRTIVARADSAETLSFSLASGASATVGAEPKPSWCGAVEAALPAPWAEVDGWLEVGVHASPHNGYCSIPLGHLPGLQARLLHLGHQLTYITRIRGAGHAS